MDVKKIKKRAQPFHPLFINARSSYDEQSIVKTNYIEKLFITTFENRIWFTLVHTSF